MRDPKGGGRRVGVEQRMRLARQDAQVVREGVTDLDAILQEVGMPHDVVGNIVLRSKGHARA